MRPLITPSAIRLMSIRTGPIKHRVLPHHPSTRRFLWLAIVLLPVFLSACQIRQEIRFNADGSGTASVTVGIDKDCRPLGTVDCDEKAQRLLGGEGPVAQAKADAERLPFDVRVEPFESPTETGYTLSFDFASLEDLERKLAPDPTTGRSQTSPFEFSGMAFQTNGDGGFTFTAESVLSVSYGAEMWLAIVLPGGEGEHNADVAEGAEGGTRFQWLFHGEENEQYSTKQFQASTCSRGSCPRSSTPILVVVAVAVMAAAVFAFVLRRRQRDERSRRGSGQVV